jgi:hypothetical protein
MALNIILITDNLHLLFEGDKMDGVGGKKEGMTRERLLPTGGLDAVRLSEMKTVG